MDKMGTKSVKEFHDIMAKVIAEKYAPFIDLPETTGTKCDKIVVVHEELERLIRCVSSKTELSITQIYSQTIIDLNLGL